MKSPRDSAVTMIYKELHKKGICWGIIFHMEYFIQLFTQKKTLQRKSKLMTGDVGWQGQVCKNKLVLIEKIFINHLVNTDSKYSTWLSPLRIYSCLFPYKPVHEILWCSRILAKSEAREQLKLITSHFLWRRLYRNMLAVKSVNLSLTWHLGNTSTLKHENTALELKHFFFFLFFTLSTKIYDVATENLFIFGTRSGLSHV